MHIKVHKGSCLFTSDVRFTSDLSRSSLWTGRTSLANRTESFETVHISNPSPQSTSYLHYSVYQCAWLSLGVKINQYPELFSYSSPIIHWWLNCCEKRTDEQSRAADRRSMNVYSGNQGNALSATCWQTVNLRLIQLNCCLFHAEIFLCIISQNWRKNILFLLQIVKLYSQSCSHKVLKVLDFDFEI